MRPKRIMLETPLYVMTHGVKQGVWGGSVIGTMMIPFFGTIAGGAIGVAFGGVAYFIVGMMLAILLLVMGTEGVHRSQKWIRVLSGFCVGTVFLYFEFEIVKDLLFTNTEHTIVLSVIIMVIALIPGIAAAYTTDNWQRWLRDSTPRKSKQRSKSETIHVDVINVSNRLLERLGKRIRWVFFLTPIIVIVATLGHTYYRPLPIYELLTWPFFASVMIYIYLFCQIVLLTATVMPIIMVANRYLFTVDTDPGIYKRNLSILTFCLVLPSQLVVAAVIGAPIAAIIATLAVRDYADRVHSPEKAKRLQKSGKKRDSQHIPSPEMPILEAEASPQQATQ